MYSGIIATSEKDESSSKWVAGKDGGEIQKNCIATNKIWGLKSNERQSCSRTISIWIAKEESVTNLLNNEIVIEM